MSPDFDYFYPLAFFQPHLSDEVIVGVTALAAPEWLIEIEAVAVAD